MANTIKTKIGILKGMYLVYLSLFSPKRFLEEENDIIFQNSLPKEQRKAGIFNVRRALLNSLLLIIISGAFGCGVGLFLSFVNGSPKSSYILAIQIAGALILLWATLAVRGWDIQTCGGVTLTERVNQWIYRFLYCFRNIIIYHIFSMDLKHN